MLFTNRNRLLSQEGALLAYSGYCENEKDAKALAAIASNIWSSYDKHGRTAFRDDRLTFVVLDCEVGHVAITQVIHYIISHSKLHLKYFLITKFYII